MANDRPVIHVVFPGQTPPPAPAQLSDEDIKHIHTGQLIPNPQAIHSMAREIRKWRGEPNPDSV